MKQNTILKSMLIWTGIIPLAILNGGLREAILRPILGDVALPISGIILSGMAFLLTYMFIQRLGKNEQSTYIKMGLIWTIATVVFEFALGFATGDTLENMLAAYNMQGGNLWPFVIIFIGSTPWLTAKIKRII